MFEGLDNSYHPCSDINPKVFSIVFSLIPIITFSNPMSSRPAYLASLQGSCQGSAALSGCEVRSFPAAEDHRHPTHIGLYRDNGQEDGNY